MKSVRLFFPQENVCSSAHGTLPAWNKSHTRHKSRPHRLVSHPVNHVFRIADKCDWILMQDIYWYWKRKYSLTPALICFAGHLFNAVQNFNGNDTEMCLVVQEAIRQRRMYLGEIIEWSDATKDIDLVPFDEHLPEDLTSAQPLPVQLVEQFLARPSVFTAEDMEAIRCAL